MSTKCLRSSGISVLAVLLLTGTGFAETYSIDAVHSSVGFGVRHIVSRVSGGFTDFSGTIMYNPDHPEKSSVEVTIKVASINTNSGRRDNHLRSPDFFDAEKYPEIMFKSTAAKKQGDKLMVTGDLTMHGVTKSVVVPVEVLGVGTHPMSKARVAGFAADPLFSRQQLRQGEADGAERTKLQELTALEVATAADRGVLFSQEVEHEIVSVSLVSFPCPASTRKTLFFSGKRHYLDGGYLLPKRKYSNGDNSR